eukprot:5881194-Pyramimonas_sp.AAC.1
MGISTPSHFMFLPALSDRLASSPLCSGRGASWPRAGAARAAQLLGLQLAPRLPRAMPSARAGAPTLEKIGPRAH